jgi:hypothetical protein
MVIVKKYEVKQVINSIVEKLIVLFITLSPCCNSKLKSCGSRVRMYIDKMELRNS